MIEKSREFVAVLQFLAFDNFDLTRKLWKKYLVEKNREIATLL